MYKQVSATLTAKKVMIPRVEVKKLLDLSFLVTGKLKSKSFFTSTLGIITVYSAKVLHNSYVFFSMAP